MQNDSPSENNLLNSELPLPGSSPSPSAQPIVASSAPEPSAPATPTSANTPADTASRLAKTRLKNSESSPELPKRRSKKPLFICLGIFSGLLLSAVAVFFFVFHGNLSELPFLNNSNDKDISSLEPSTPSEEEPESPAEKKESEPVAKFYSRLSGEPISSEAENSAPTFCVQVPNGMDGARPQAGLTEAKVVFEAIAEAGITRFAAIFQNPPAVIGPIRSLRLYYLNWDVPFDCTVVHAGGAADALSALKSYGSRDLTENYSYMWRSAQNGKLNRLWNNLFTSGDYLKSFNESKGYLTSDIKSFPHLVPEIASRDKIDRQAVEKLKIDTPAIGDTDALTAKVSRIHFRFGNMPNFNPVFTYNAETNSYDRSYETGTAHIVYDCAGQSGEITPEVSCAEKQLSPKVVIGMMVQERKASDNYHEDISVIGAGDAYIFQNGDVIKGSWEKSSKDSRIIFRADSGDEIALVPGQTWISAIPASYGGSVNYE